MGHTLGLDHNETGLMAPSETDPYRSETVRKDDINKMIQYPLKGKVNSGKSTDGKTTDTGAGKLSPNSSKIDLGKYDGKVIQKE